MRVLRSLAVALSAFSRIPAPRVVWEAQNMCWSMAFLPVIGGVIGVLTLLWNGLASLLELGPFLRGTGFALLPLLVTGGIHLDGFCDTVDALASHADRDKKQAILRDPHTGAFAVMALTAYLLGFAALCSELSGVRTAAAFSCVFILSRCLCGIAVTRFPCSLDSGLARCFADTPVKGTVSCILAAIALLTAAAMAGLAGVSGGVAALCALGVCCVQRFWLIGQFGGLSGDLAGWALQVCEICALAGLVFTKKLGCL